MTDWSQIEDSFHTSKASDNASPWEAIEDDFAKARQSQAAAVNVVAQTEDDADKVARANAIGRQLNIPPVLVQSNLPEFEQRLAIKNSGAVLANSPGLQNWLIQNPEKAIVARDDYDKLGYISKMGSAFLGAEENAMQEGERIGLYRKMQDGTASPNDLVRYQELKAKPQSQEPVGIGPKFAGMLGGVAGMLAESYGSPEAIKGAAIGTGAGAMVGAAGAPETAGLSLLAGSEAGAKVGMTAGAIYHAVQNGFAGSMEKSADIVDASGNHLDYYARLGMASVEGTVNGLMTKLGGGVAADAVNSAMRDFVSRPTIQAALTAYGKSVSKAGLHAGAVGAGAAGAEIAAENVARGLTNMVDASQFETIATNSEMAKEAASQILNEGLKWAAFGSSLHGSMGMIGLGNDVMRARDSQRSIGQINSLLDASADSKLRARDDEAFRSFFQDQVNGSPVENLYVSPDKVMELYQHFGINPLKMVEPDPLFGWSPDFVNRLKEAQETGTDVKISTADYAARLAGTDADKLLRPNLKPEGGYSANDIEVANQQFHDEFQRQYEALNKELSLQMAAKSPAEAVYNDLYHKLLVAGRTSTEAHNAAMIWAARYGTKAEIMNDNGGYGGDLTDAWSEYSRTHFGIQNLADVPERPLRPGEFSTLDAYLNDIRTGDKGISKENSTGLSLIEWLSRNGGLQDDGGILASRDLHLWHVGKPFARRLVRSSKNAGEEAATKDMFGEAATMKAKKSGGMTLEDAAVAAAEMGYLPELKSELDDAEGGPAKIYRINALLDALDRDAATKGGAVFSEIMANDDAIQRVKAMEDLHRALDEAGIDLKDERWKDNRDVKDALRLADDKRREDDGLNKEFEQAVNSGVDPERMVKVADVTGMIGADRSSKALKAMVQRLIGTPLSTADQDALVKVLPRNVNHIVFSGAPIFRQDNAVRGAAINSMADLLENAALIESGLNRKESKKPDIDSYHRFYVPVWDGNSTRVVRIVAEQTKDGIAISPKDYDLYDIVMEKKRLPPKKVVSGKTGTVASELGGQPLHEVSIRQMLTGVKGMDGKKYFQSLLAHDMAKSGVQYKEETIHVEGKERTVYNSKGQRLAQTAEGLTNFWKWFGDSKVVDEEGKPLVVYHGTAAPVDFEEFAGSRAYYFSKSHDVANSYAKERGMSDFILWGDSSEKIMPVYLRLKNPLDVDAGFKKYDPNIVEGKLDRAKFETDGSGNRYDGMTVTDIIDDYNQRGKPSDIFVAFDPTQIKSLYNRGTFDGEDPRILFQSKPSSAKTWSDDLGRMMRGGMHSSSTLLRVGGTPAVLSKLGLKEQPLCMSQSVVKKVALDKHNIHPDTLHSLPDLLADPVMVFDSTHNDGSLVAVLGADDMNGNPVIASVSEGGAVNFVTSVYGKDRKAWFSNQIADNRLRYIDEEKAAQWFSVQGLQLPERKPLVGLDNKVLTKVDLVNIHKQENLNDAPHGSIRFFNKPGEPIDAMINLFTGRANRSTFMHESAHLWLEEMIRDAADSEMPDVFRNDLATLTKWMGVERPEDIATEHHERFARAFEQYLMEGKAPSERLASVFGRFKSWLRNIYRAIAGRVGAATPEEGLANDAGLSINIDPEIKDIFDRMLASEDEIKAMQEKQGGSQMFRSAEEAQMTPEQFSDYQVAVQVAHNEAVDAVEKKMLAALRREREEWWKAESAKTKEDVAQETDTRPDIQAYLAIRSGKVKFNAESLERLYGSRGVLHELRGKYVKKGGLEPEIVAEMFGFDSAQDMLAKVIDLTRLSKETGRNARDEIIDRQTKQLMAEHYGDPLHDGSLLDEASKAVHNDKQGEVLARELAALDARARSTTYQGQKWLVGKAKVWEIAKARAEFVIKEKSVRDVLSLSDYSRAEAKAGKEALMAAAKGDYEAASKAKQQQIMASAMWKAARNANEEIAKGQKLLSRYAEKRTIKSIDQDYLDQIHALLERFDFKPASANEVARRANLARWIQEQEDNGNEVVISDKLANAAFSQHFSEMSVSDFGGLVDAVKNIAHLGRLKQKLIDGKNQREFDEWRTEAIEALDNVPKKAAPTNIVVGGSSDLRGLIERTGMGLKKGLFELLKAETIIDWLDNSDPNGPFNRTLFKPMKEALFKQYERSGEMVERLKELEKQMPKDWSKSLDEVVNLPMRNRDGSLMKGEKRHVIGIALNWGNESNRDKLLRGEGWHSDDVENAFKKYMTSHDWQFVQGVWDLFETLRPDIAAMEKRLSGVEPEWVEHTAFDISTSDDIGASLRGGYFPMIYDPVRSERAGQNLDKDASALYDRSTYFRATTNKSHTKSRIENYAAPVDFRSLDLLPHRIGQVIHDLYFREPINQANRILNNKSIRQPIIDRFGKEAVQALDDWVRSAANDRNIDTANYTVIERVLGKFRANVVAVGIAFRVSTILKHDLSALSMSMETVGVRNFMAATADLFQGGLSRQNELVRMIKEKSGEIRHRMDAYDRDTARQMDKLGQYVGLDTVQGATRGVVKFIDEFNHLGHLPVSYLDFLSTLPVWLSTYRKGIADGMPETDAVYAADKSVRKAHGAQSILDQSKIQKGSELKKMLTMFYGFFNRIFNGGADAVRNVSLGVRGMKDGNKDIAQENFMKAASYAVGSLAVPALIESVVAGHAPGEDDNWFGFAGKAVMGQALATVPLVRDLAGSFLHGRGYEFSPVVRSVNQLVQFVRDDLVNPFLNDEAMTHGALKRGITSAGLATGLGTGQLAQSAQYFWDVIEKREHPKDAAEFLRGLAMGPHPKES